jgi:hypothetical protein
MSQQNVNRKKLAQGLIGAALLALAGIGVCDMLKSLRRRS